MLIKQSNSVSLANGANYHPPRTLPRSEVRTSILWEQHTALHALKWVRAASPPPTPLVSLVCLVLQRKLTHFKCLAVCASSSVGQFVFLRRAAGLMCASLSSARCAGCVCSPPGPRWHGDAARCYEPRALCLARAASPGWNLLRRAPRPLRVALGLRFISRGVLGDCTLPSQPLTSEPGRCTAVSAWKLPCGAAPRAPLRERRRSRGSSWERSGAAARRAPSCPRSEVGRAGPGRGRHLTAGSGRGGPGPPRGRLPCTPKFPRLVQRERQVPPRHGVGEASRRRRSGSARAWKRGGQGAMTFARSRRGSGPEAERAAAREDGCWEPEESRPVMSPCKSLPRLWGQGCGCRPGRWGSAENPERSPERSPGRTGRASPAPTPGGE